MRSAQYLILTKLLNDVPIPEYIHAFERGRSIPAMAAQHVGKGVILSIDLKDFFTSLKQKHLQAMFEHMGIDAVPARTLSELCTYDSFVPQGALTSPKVSNLVSSLTFGQTLKQFCDSRGLTMSIYANDITISSDTDIVAERGYSATKEIVDVVTGCVESFGFRVNRKKTKVMRPFQRQYVCGVVVNRRTNLQQKERRRLRAIVHNCEVNGIAAEAAKNDLSSETFASQITGKLGWFGQLNSEAAGALQTRFKAVVATPPTETPTEPSDGLSEASVGTEVPWSEAPLPSA